METEAAATLLAGILSKRGIETPAKLLLKLIKPGQEMGQQVTKEEGAILRLLLHILSKRGVKYDERMLRRLLTWCRENGFAPEPRTAFKPEIREAVGKKLWEMISKGDKEASPLATTWWLVLSTLQDMNAERATTAGAFAALQPTGGGSNRPGPKVWDNPLLIPSAPSEADGGGRMSAEKDRVGAVCS